jgi:biopolymer transport protein ExbD
MKASRLRAKLRRVRAESADAAEEGGELNLVPYLDIVTNVIMFLLATTAFVAALGDVRIAAAETGPGPGVPELSLSVTVTDRGFTVATFDAVEPLIPKRNGSYDFAALSTRLDEIKRSTAGRDESRATLNAAPAISYEVVVSTLDAMRGPHDERFTNLMLATGISVQ